jgi:hypothetical protein
MNMPPLSALPSENQSLPDNNSVAKKRKLEDRDVVTKDDSEGLNRMQELEVAYRRTKGAYLQEKEQRLVIQSKLNKKEDMVHKLKDKHEEVVEGQRQEMTRMWKDSIKQEGITVDLRTKLTQRDITINQLELENHKLKEVIRQLKITNHKLIENVSGPPRRREPSFVPHLDPKVHSHTEYEHPEAPRQNKMYKRFKESREYAPGTGKVWPSKYGSGGNWDLGLCRVTFDSPHVCVDDGCEYRHDPLSVNERTYMQFLDPSGPKFLRHSDKYLEDKPARSI